MGLHRLYWIPDELTGDKGVYVEYPADELWAILSLESHRHRAGIVGENLGTVPPEVNAAMTKHDIRQMYVVQYEIMGDLKNPFLRPPSRKCVASLNTHDMPPFRAFLDGTDIADRVKLGFIDEKIATKERRERRLMRNAIERWRKVSPLRRGTAAERSDRQGVAHKLCRRRDFLCQSRSAYRIHSTSNLLRCIIASYEKRVLAVSGHFARVDLAVRPSRRCRTL